MKTLPLVGVLVGISLVGCKSGSSAVSSEINANDEIGPKISSQKIYEGAVMVTVVDDMGKKKDVPRGKCVTKISKDNQGNIVKVQVGKIKIGVLEDKSKELSTPNGFFSIDSTLKIVETNFKPQPSVARLGYTRIAYELAKNSQGGTLEQYAVVRGLSDDKIDVIEAYNRRKDFPNLNAEIVCNDNKALKFSTFADALSSGWEGLAPALPASSQTEFLTKLKAIVAFVEKNGYDWLKRNDNPPLQDELTKLMDDVAALSVQALRENTKGKGEVSVGKAGLAKSLLESVCLAIPKQDVYEFYGELQDLAGYLKGL